MIGRADGDDIVQSGTRPDRPALDALEFSEITADSFRWRGEFSADNGASWRVNTSSPRSAGLHLFGMILFGKPAATFRIMLVRIFSQIGSASV